MSYGYSRVGQQQQGGRPASVAKAGCWERPHYHTLQPRYNFFPTQQLYWAMRLQYIVNANFPQVNSSNTLCLPVSSKNELTHVEVIFFFVYLSNYASWNEYWIYEPNYHPKTRSLVLFSCYSSFSIALTAASSFLLRLLILSVFISSHSPTMSW